MRNCFKNDPDQKQFLKDQYYDSWLKSIHWGLPKHIKERHSHLFTKDKPNWAYLQPDFVKMMDTFITEVEIERVMSMIQGLEGLEGSVRLFEEEADVEEIPEVEEEIDPIPKRVDQDKVTSVTYVT